MADAIISFFDNLLGNDILTIFIISMIPIIELRGAIPVAIKMGLTWYESFGYAFLGSIVVAPVLLLILLPILKAMKKVKFFRSIANAVEHLFQSKAESVRKKAGKANSKLTEDLIKIFGVFLFVAIPLPLTGVWTGSAVAVFLGLGFWKSLIAVALGNVSAGLIMSGLSLLFKDNLNTFLTVFLIVVLVVLVLNIIYLVVKSKLKKKKLEKELVNTQLFEEEKNDENANGLNAQLENTNDTALQEQTQSIQNNEVIDTKEIDNQENNNTGENIDKNNSDAPIN